MAGDGDGTENTDGHNFKVNHKSLLAKYEIPIDHLSYEYIRACSNVKELERIVKILRSGEEGYFPDLQKTAEDRLRHWSPNNRHLRSDKPALDRNCFSKQDWANIMGDIEHWKKEVTDRDKQLSNGDDPEISLPPVRQTLLTKQPSGGGSGSRPKTKTKTSDYAFWDKYDVDTELLKIDLEEERKKSNHQKTSMEETETDRLQLVVKEAEKCSETEKVIIAEQEKLRGNEYYHAKDFAQAEKYYTASLAVLPKANVYNNRASCYLKQGKYSEAVKDADRTLKLEPGNVKALYRKGLALKHMNENQKALENMEAVLRQEPNQSQARSVAKELTEMINAEVKTPGSVEKKSIQNVCTNVSSYGHTRSESTRCFEVNEWGLPKTLCPCLGTLRSNFAENKTDNKPSLLSRRSIFEKKSENARIVELPDENEQPIQKHPTKLEIIEVDSTHHEPLKDLFAPKKVVVDKRTRNKNVEHGGGDMN